MNKYVVAAFSENGVRRWYAGRFLIDGLFDSRLCTFATKEEADEAHKVVKISWPDVKNVRTYVLGVSAYPV